MRAQAVVVAITSFCKLDFDFCGEWSGNFIIKRKPLARQDPNEFAFEDLGEIGRVAACFGDAKRNAIEITPRVFLAFGQASDRNRRFIGAR